MSYNEEFDFEKWKKEYNYEVGVGYEEVLKTFNRSKNPQCTTKKPQKSQAHTNFNNT